MTENQYRAKLIKTLNRRFPGCLVLKNDPKDHQGMLDLTMLYGEHWASFEVKRSSDAAHRPNQEYFVRILDDMSFAAFIYPENEEEVLDALQQAFESPRGTRVSVA